ncbi:hypothetical protein CCACVL1_26981 [Corchorus capsularis]|uniref:Uncharacterized protein n=1 Tax=Corchorus capsularis TaxID=210143 RepID=A0A1R3GCN1_COCAP|nr:hypothetical protein CCACVL1_26981 [Corchorus capsularis]
MALLWGTKTYHHVSSRVSRRQLQTTAANLPI